MWTRITYSHVFYGDVVSGEEYNLILGGLDTFSIGSYSGILPGNRKWEEFWKEKTFLFNTNIQEQSAYFQCSGDITF